MFVVTFTQVHYALTTLYKKHKHKHEQETKVFHSLVSAMATKGATATHPITETVVWREISVKIMLCSVLFIWVPTFYKFWHPLFIWVPSFYFNIYPLFIWVPSFYFSIYPLFIWIPSFYFSIYPLFIWVPSFYFVVPLLKDPSHKRPPPVTDHYYLAQIHLMYIL